MARLFAYISLYCSDSARYIFEWDQLITESVI